MARLAPLAMIVLLGFAACSGNGSPCHAQCAANSSCNVLTAQCACNPGFTSCGGACISLQDDRHNCGTCGKDCGGLDCVLGSCGCAPPKALCSVDGGVSYCADIAHDIDNCGGCGTLCGDAGAGEAARAAAWQCFSDTGGPGVCTCNGHFDYCQVSGATLPDCIDVSADSQNCGACGHVCVGGLCKADVCNCSRPGYVACATTTEATDPSWCHLPLTTDTHCGDADPDHCGVNCTKLNSVCSAGLCVCAPGYADCPVAGANQCVDIATDRYDCGSCGHLCTGGNCANQLCDCTYPGYTACASTTSTTDPEWCHLPELSVRHCGDDATHCGVDCTSSGVSTAFCSGGQCSCSLPSGDAGTLCPPDGGPTGFCADVLTDPLNCGACYTPIFDPFDICANGLPSCDLSRGEQLCALPTEAFCTNINRGDPAHCGACSGPSSDCSTWNGTNSICESSNCLCAPDVTTTNGGKPDGGPASYCIMSVSQGQCSCNASQQCPAESMPLSWGHDIFPLFQTGPGGTTSASKLGCSASGCHTGGETQAAGHLDLSDVDAGYTGLMTGPIFGNKTCATTGPPTTGTFDCPCVAAALPNPKDPTQSSVLTSLLATGNFPQMCVTQLVHNDGMNNRLVFSPCAQLIVADWIGDGALP